jgi:hypothetical protein
MKQTQKSAAWFTSRRAKREPEKLREIAQPAHEVARRAGIIQPHAHIAQQHVAQQAISQWTKVIMFMTVMQSIHAANRGSLYAAVLRLSTHRERRQCTLCASGCA